MKCSELSRMVRTVAIDFSPQIVANRSEPSRIVIGDGLGAIDDGLGAIGDGEAHRRLRLGVRRLGLGVTATGFVFQKNKN